MTTAPTLQERIALAIEPPQLFLVTYTPDGRAHLAGSDMRTLKVRYAERELLIRALAARNAELERRAGSVKAALHDAQDACAEGRIFAVKLAIAGALDILCEPFPTGREP